MIAFPFTVICQTVSINAGNFEAVKIDTIGNAGRINLPGNLRSILIGQDVGNSNSIGINNIFIGKDNGNQNSLGAYNVTLGHFAG